VKAYWDYAGNVFCRFLMKTESNRFFCFQTKLPIAIFKTFRYLRKLSKILLH